VIVGAATSQWTVAVPAKARGAARISLSHPGPPCPEKDGSLHGEQVPYFLRFVVVAAYTGILGDMSLWVGVP
jgi:hypothetical protein